MPTETALSRERAKRCPEGCGRGFNRYEVSDPARSHKLGYGFYHYRGNGEFCFPCQAPPDADLYEELAKERDELKADIHLIGAGQKKLVLFGGLGCLTDDCEHWDSGACNSKSPHCRIGRTIAREKEKANG